MANIPGACNRLPSADPIIELKIGPPEGRLITDGWGSKFIIDGNIRIAAVAVLKYVTDQSGAVFGSMHSAFDPVKGKISEIELSRLRFRFDNSIVVGLSSYGNHTEDNKQEALKLIEEIQKIIELKAFL